MCAAVNTSSIGKFDLNPRGNLWLKDENRFGHKLLSKMGWSQGKGLGKNEDGIAENVKVRMKSGNAGVGWTEKRPLAMECHEYDAILASLNEKFKTPKNEAKKESDLKNLVDRSQQFKNRLHYGKFVRGKDVCQYSEKDMKSIFGLKKSKTEPKLVSVKSSVTNIESSSMEDQKPELLPTFKSSMSMKDYFESKLKKKSWESPKVNFDADEVIVNKEICTNKEVLCKKKKKTVEKDEKSGQSEISMESNSMKMEFDNDKNEIEVSSFDSKQLKEKKSSSNATDSIQEISNATSNTRKKKRKKCHESPMKKKKAKTDLPAEANQSLNNVNDDVFCVGEFPSPDVQILRKIRRKLRKQKSDKLKKLKSCLKTNSKYSLQQESKEVSFNEQVFYKVIDGTLEYDRIEDEFTQIQTNIVCDTANETVNQDDVNLMESKSNFNNHINELEDQNSISNDVVDDELEDEDDLEEVPQCLDLPKCDKSNFNSWLENQRIAAKMKLYKNMVKKIRKHKILRTTNLLSIKGYGNWGL